MGDQWRCEHEFGAGRCRSLAEVRNQDGRRLCTTCDTREREFIERLERKYAAKVRREETNMGKNTDEKKTSKKKSSFSADDDHEIAHIGEIEEDGTTVHVSVRSYDGGPAKVAITRTLTTKSGEERHTKLGRILPETAARLGPMLVAAAKRAAAEE